MDAILTLSIIAGKTRLRYRGALLVLFVTPLPVSVGYQSFQGGSTTSDMYNTNGSFELIGPPGMQGLGYGLALHQRYGS